MVNPVVPSASYATGKWKDAIPRVGAAYKDGITRTNAETWKSRASGIGQDNYVTQMSNSDVLARRKTKIDKIPASKWKDGALKKGARNIGPAMLDAESAYNSQISKVLGVIGAVDMPERGVTAAENMARSTAVATDLEAARLAGTFD